MTHIALFDAKFSFGVTAPVYIRSKKTPRGANCDTHPAQIAGIYSNAAGARPGQHTIPNAILLSDCILVKHNCAIMVLLRRKLCNSRQMPRFGDRKTNTVVVECKASNISYLISCISQGGVPHGIQKENRLTPKAGGQSPPAFSHPGMLK